MIQLMGRFLLEGIVSSKSFFQNDVPSKFPLYSIYQKAACGFA